MDNIATRCLSDEPSGPDAVGHTLARQGALPPIADPYERRCSRPFSIGSALAACVGNAVHTRECLLAFSASTNTAGCRPVRPQAQHGRRCLQERASA